jgi:hypothetical protein
MLLMKPDPSKGLTKLTDGEELKRITVLSYSMRSVNSVTKVKLLTVMGTLIEFPGQAVEIAAVVMGAFVALPE